MTAIEPDFYLGQKTLVTISDGTTDVDLTCLTNGVETAVDQDQNDYSTFCGVFYTVGPEKWSLNVTAYAAFGPAGGGLWPQLRPLVGKVVTATVLPDADLPVSATNPEWVLEGVLKAFPFLVSTAGEAAEITVTVLGTKPPVENITPGAARSGEPKSKK
jgi:hypothetical protein